MKKTKERTNERTNQRANERMNGRTLETRWAECSNGHGQYVRKAMGSMLDVVVVVQPSS